MAVYFILDNRYNLVKIGYSNNVDRRFREIKSSLGASWPGIMEILAEIDCPNNLNKPVEKTLHRKFRKYLHDDHHPYHRTDFWSRNTMPEWFQFSDEIKQFIQKDYVEIDGNSFDVARYFAMNLSRTEGECLSKIAKHYDITPAEVMRRLLHQAAVDYVNDNEVMALLSYQYES